MENHEYWQGVSFKSLAHAEIRKARERDCIKIARLKCASAYIHAYNL